MDKFFKNAFGWLFQDQGRGLTNPFAAFSNIFKNWFGNGGIISQMFDSFGSGFDGIELGSLLSALVNRISAEHLTGAENEANNWSAGQAQIQRDFQEYFFNAYQSPMAQVQQFQQAGLNPALMYQNGVSVPSAVGGSAASSVSPQGSQMGMGQLLEILGSLGMRFKEMQADLELKSANAYKTRAEGDLIHNNIDVFAERMQRERERFTLDKAILDKRPEEIDANIKVAKAKAENLLQGVEESKAREAVAKVDEALKQVDLKTRAEYNQACLEAVQAKRRLDIAETNYKYSLGRKTEQETEYMKIKVKNAQEEYDKVFAKLEAETKKLGKESGLLEKESKFFEKKFDIQVAGVINGAIQAAKMSSGTRFQSGAQGFSNYLSDMSGTARNFSNLSWINR